MAGGGFQKGGPGRANSVEGGNVVPVVEVGTKRTRPVLRGDLVEGLFAWCPDGTYGIYAGFPTDSNVTHNVVRLYKYTVSTNALTDITPTVDCNGNSLDPTNPVPLTVQFLAVKFAPFFSPAINGYFCYILARVTTVVGTITTASTQIWLYNGGTVTITVPSLDAGVTTHDFDLVAGAVNTYDASAPHQSSYFCLPIKNAGGFPAEYTPPWVAWNYLSACTSSDDSSTHPVDYHVGIGIFRDIDFSWGGDTTAPNVEQIPYGLVVGDSVAYWGVPGSLVYTQNIIEVTMGSAGYYPCAPTDIGHEVVGSIGVDEGVLLAYDNTTRVWTIQTISGMFITIGEKCTLTPASGIGTSVAVNPITTSNPNIYCIEFTDGSQGGDKFIPYRSLEFVETSSNYPRLGNNVTSKLTMFRKGVSMLTFNTTPTNPGGGGGNPGTAQNRVFEATGNSGLTYFQQVVGMTGWESFGRIRRTGDIPGAPSGITFTEIEELMNYTSGVQEVVMNAGITYVPCVPGDIGKIVKDATGLHSGVLLAYDNGTRKWDIQTTATFNNSDVCSVSTGVGRGTISAAFWSWTPSIPFSGVNANDPMSRPTYTDITWGPNRNALYVVGREGHIKTTTNRKWIFADPVDVAYHVDDNQYPDSTTIHTGIQWSPDGVGYLLTSKTFNSDPDNSAGTVPIESVSDAFVRNLVTYYAPSTGYQEFTLNESKVTGFPFSSLNQFGIEHYRFAWHPMARYSYFSVFGGFEKFDYDLYVETGIINVAATVVIPVPLHVAIDDASGSPTANVVTDGFFGSGPNNHALLTETHVVTNTHDILHVQTTQQLAGTELDYTKSLAASLNIHPTAPTYLAIAYTIDKDYDTFSTLVADGPWSLVQVFASPILISRVSALGNALEDVQLWAVPLTDPTGVTPASWVPLTSPITGPTTTVDSGSFAPFMAMGVAMTGVTSTFAAVKIREIVTLKVIKTEGTIATTPADPVMAQLQQQITMADVYSVIGTGVYLSTHDCTVLFDKDLATYLTYPKSSGPDTITTDLTHPKLMSRLVLTGLFDVGDEIVVTLTTSNGPLEVIRRTVVDHPITAPTLALDSGNFQAVIAQQIVVSVKSGASDIILDELAIFKDIKVEIADQDGFATALITGSSASAIVYNTDPICGNVVDPTSPTPYLAPTSLGKSGVKIYTQNVNCELQLAPTGGATTIKGFIDWYWSDNDLDYYYMASSDISDTAGDDGYGNLSPTGFNNTNDTSFQNIACPENAVGKYVNIVVRNTDTTPAEAVSFIVLSAKITQR